MASQIGMEIEPTRIDVSSSWFFPGNCYCHDLPMSLAQENYPLTLHGRSWIIAGLYTVRCSLEPQTQEKYTDPIGTNEALGKIFAICFPERAAWSKIMGEVY